MQVKTKRPTKEQVDARVTDILRIMLDGAQRWDYLEFVREREKEPGNPWSLADGGQPISYMQIRRYVSRAKRIIAETGQGERQQILQAHVAIRKNLFAKANAQGDIKAALACAESELKVWALMGVIPSENKPAHQGEYPSLSVMVQTLIQAEGKVSVSQTVREPEKLPVVIGDNGDEPGNAIRDATAVSGSEALP